MSAVPRQTEIRDTPDLHQLLSSLENPGAPALLLSASVPYLRKELAEATPDEKAQQFAINQRYLSTSQPERIRLAVKELTESALMRGMRLVFGAHPAISPMVLEAARTIAAADDSILIFQSVIFRKELPNSTLELADWSKGRLIFTPERMGPRPMDRRRLSLTQMRTLMAQPRTLQGAVFVGGMEGTEEEAAIFRTEQGERPRYAIASTGSAALEMFNRTPNQFAGYLKQQDWKYLQDYPTSYKLVARRILDDMGVAAPSRGRG
jgi:SLOG cluster3 family